MLPDAHRVLAGRRARLEPLSADAHAGDLHAAQEGDPALWEFMPYGPFGDAGAFRAHVAAQAGSSDPAFFAVIDLAGSGRAAGVTSYLRAEPDHRVIEIGHIWFGPALQRTVQATEALFLMMDHAFRGLGVRRLEWKCNAANERSRAAAARLGFTYEGTFRQHMIVKGRNRDTAWFSIVDDEWPALRERFETWLDPSNFDAAGRQRQPLRASG